MPGSLYPDPAPPVLRVPRPLPGTFTRGVAFFTLSGEDSTGVEVVNPPFLGLFLQPTARWSGQALLGGLFRATASDWTSRVTSSGQTPAPDEVAPDTQPLPAAGDPKAGSDV